jgi:SAM-dependent methyltransferase
MQKRHSDRTRYFNEQSATTRKYVIPFIEEKMKIDSSVSVLEPGCGEAGNLEPFLEIGCKSVGVDYDVQRIELGKTFYQDHPKRHLLNLIGEDMYKVEGQLTGQFDLIIMRDTIEHIHDQQRFMEYIKRFLKPGGKIFFAFPPWMMPFGGHQQLCSSKFLSVLPYFHLLPDFLYIGLLKIFGEEQWRIDSLLEIKETRLPLEKFERILKDTGYQVDKRTLYFIQPNYETKFKLKTRKLNSFFASFSWLRNFYCTAGYYLVSRKESQQ